MKVCAITFTIALMNDIYFYLHVYILHVIEHFIILELQNP